MSSTPTLDSNNCYIKPIAKSKSPLKNRRKNDATKFASKDFAHRLNCHGLHDLLTSKSRPSRIFWGCVFLIAMATLIYCVVECFKEFYFNPILTTTMVEIQKSIKFPKILICPSNFVNASSSSLQNPDTKRMVQYYKSVLAGEGLLGLESKMSLLFSPPTPITESGQGEVFSFVPKVEKQYYAILNASLDTDKFILDCSFQSKSCFENISKILHKEFGVCFLIDVNSSQTTPKNGLGLLIDIHSELNDPSAPLLAEGITVMIMDEMEPVHARSVLLSPGTSSQIRLEARFDRFISGKEFSQSNQICYENGDIDFQIVNASYSRGACELDCLQQTLLASDANCILPMDISFIKHNFYNPEAESRLMAEIKLSFNNESIDQIPKDQLLPIVDKFYNTFVHFCENLQMLDNIDEAQLDKCSSKCYRACTQHKFDVALSFHKLPSSQILKNYAAAKRFNSTNEDYLDKFKSNEARIAKWDANLNLLSNVSRWADNVIVLDIAFTNLELVSWIQHPAMTMNTLLSNLGGFCGLWMGASCITILQLNVFLIKFCITKCCRKDDVDDDDDDEDDEIECEACRTD